MELRKYAMTMNHDNDNERGNRCMGASREPGKVRKFDPVGGFFCVKITHMPHLNWPGRSSPPLPIGSHRGAVKSGPSPMAAGRNGEYLPMIDDARNEHAPLSYFSGMAVALCSIG